MDHHARGTFEVNMQPLSDSPAPGIARMSIEKQFHGDLEATSKGEIILAGDPKAGEAGYVGMETVTGTLAGKSGSFVLQHFATMDKSGQEMQVIVAPGSSAGALQGLAGRMTILIEAGQHSYTFDYSLPAQQ